MNKATHIGTCQACGSTQKLPNGKLAKHGYEVWGCFVGTCAGSTNQPYEQSCELIQKFIANAEQRRAELKAERAKWLQPATEPKGWYHEYVTTRGLAYSYQWNYVELREKPLAHTTEYKLEVYVDYTGKEQRLPVYGRHSGLLEAATLMNKAYVEQFIQPRIQELERYIAWQQQRVWDWKLVKLRPVPPEPTIDPNRKPRQRRRW